MDLHLCPVSADDDAFLRGLYATTRAEEVEAWGWSEDERDAFLDMQYHLQRQSYEVQFPGADHQIVLNGEERLGRLFVLRTGDELRLVDISLLPEYRRRGIGTTLLGQLLTEAGRAGQTVGLQVLAASPAIRLYERLGFTAVSDDGVYVQMEAHPP